jgi:peptidoglycan/xylan/chitin deacetylase (PgdA/CDA1 family)
MLPMAISANSMIAKRGMIVGSHSISHPVFGTLLPKAQERESTDSFAFLEEASEGAA